MQSADILVLPERVIDRVKLMELWKSGVMTQVEAARALKISERHFRRLIRRYESQGALGAPF